MMDWTQYDDMVDAELLNKLQDLESGKKSGGEYEKVPFGHYEVVPEKMELTTSKNGNPMTTIWLRIVAGPYRNSVLFARFVMKSAFGIHNVKSFVRSLDPTCRVDFESFTQWDIMLKGVAEELCGKASYVVDYSETESKKGDKFDNYSIEDGPFEVPKDYVAPKPKNVREDDYGRSPGYPA